MTALAAGLAGLLVGAGGTYAALQWRASSGANPAPSVANVTPKERLLPVRFTLVAPNAVRVTLVGDFNAWNPRALPMRRVADGHTWEVEVSLTPGRYAYAFVVDGRLARDPSAPEGSGDDYGTTQLDSAGATAARSWPVTVRFVRVVFLSLLVLGVAPGAASAQQAVAGIDTLPRLPSTLGSAARSMIVGVMDSARAAGLPTAPLADKAAEGVLKGADDARIVAAVRSLARELREARDILGVARNPALLGTVASAVHAGIPESDLRGLAHPVHGEPPSPEVLESALVTAVDLVAKHVEPTAATASIRALLDRHAPAAQFVELRTEVDQAIRAGQSPAAALDATTRAHVRILEGLPGGGPAIR